MTRYKSASESGEKIEDELKVEKRKLQREVFVFTQSISLLLLSLRRVTALTRVPQLRSALDRIEELELSNSHLVKRLEKMKANRNALLAQQ